MNSPQAEDTTTAIKSNKIHQFDVSNCDKDNWLQRRDNLWIYFAGCNTRPERITDNEYSQEIRELWLLRHDLVVRKHLSTVLDWFKRAKAKRKIKARKPAKRRALDRNRFKYFYIIGNRDGFVCKACGINRNLSIDHIFPLERGGNNSLDNLQILCRPCNSRKGAK